MSDPSVLFDQLDRRARFVRGLRYAGLLAASVAGIALLAAILSAVIARPMANFVLIATSAFVVLGGIGFVLGLRLPFHLPLILMRADVALGLEATLSTLNDIRNKPEMKLFSKRIEARLPSTPPQPSDAFPIDWREVGFLGTAVAMIVGAILIATIPMSNRQIEIQPNVAIDAVMEASDSELVVETTGETPSTAQADTEAPHDTSSPETTETLTLGDILTTIRPTPATVTASNSEIDEATLRLRQTPELSLEEVLRQIEDTLLEDESQSLSVLETEALEAHRESAHGEIAERLEQILESSSRDEILEHVSQILADPELADASQGLELPADEQEHIEVAQVGPGVEPDSPPLMLDTSTEQGGQLVFVETALPSADGDEGDYTYYLTKGVPIEPPSDTTESSYENLDLSYEQLESIASSRSLDPDVVDTIKAYFDRIARGGS